ncbi:MAG: PHP domain-containing protein [Candidatus Dormibacteraceae bacterium]
MPLPPDLHVHTEWSWDAPHGSMELSCERALQVGLPGIAFTEHADFVVIHEGQHDFDVGGYIEVVEQCRAKFKNLRILTGVELGEPHWFPDETAAVLSAGRLDRVLGSVHCVRVNGQPVDASQFRELPAPQFTLALHEYFRETLALVESSQPFEALAHLDYPKRYWPESLPPYREQDYEEELRAILTAAAKRELVLEVNTTRGRVLCPDVAVVRWWREVGGKAVQYGSDAHQPDKVAAGFELATHMVEGVGFKPARDPMSLWRR